MVSSFLQLEEELLQFITEGNITIDQNGLIYDAFPALLKTIITDTDTFWTLINSFQCGGGTCSFPFWPLNINKLRSEILWEIQKYVYIKNIYQRMFYGIFIFSLVIKIINLYYYLWYIVMYNTFSFQL